VGLDKTYTATIRLGASTPTDDADSAPDRFAPAPAVDAVDAAAVDAALPRLRGDILQTPSAVSAIKVDGRRAYARVRAGEDVELEARPVTVSRLERVSDPRRETVVDAQGRTCGVVDVDVVVDCSSGTYVRALARDLGAALGVHGHLTRLRRTHVGDYAIDDALAVPDFEADVPPPVLLPPAEAAAGLLAVLTVTAEQARDLRMGRRIAADGSADGGSPRVAVVPGEPADLVAVVDVREGEAAPRVVFPAQT
jgi:tRNA pseudouridine55 synthase